MKRSSLVNLICSAIIVIALMIAVVVAVIFATINEKSNKLVISSSSSAAVYNGQPLTNDAWELVEGELKDGHRLSVKVSGSQTNVGISENFISAVVFDINGRNVSKSYDIEYRPGSLNVKARSITLKRRRPIFPT